MNTADWFYWAGIALLVVGCFSTHIRLGKYIYITGLASIATAAVLYSPGARGSVPAALMVVVIVLMLITPERVSTWFWGLLGKKERENDAGEEVDEGQVDGVGSEEAQGGEDV